MQQMKKLLASFAAASLVFVPTLARAITLPDKSTCATTDTCLKIINTAISGMAAEFAGDFTNGVGLFGYGEIGIQAHGRVTGIESFADDGGTGLAGHTVTGGIGVYGVVTPAGTGTAIYGENSDTGTGSWAGYFHGRVKVNGIPYSSTQSMFTVQSDARLKKNIQPLAGSLDRLLKLKGVTFEWKDPAQHGNLADRQTGFIAQQVEKVIPEWVSQDADGYKNIATRGIEAMLVESIRTLKTENDALSARVNTLEERRSFAAAGFTAVGPFGLGVAMALGAMFLSRRRREDIARAQVATHAAT